MWLVVVGRWLGLGWGWQLRHGHEHDVVLAALRRGTGLVAHWATAMRTTVRPQVSSVFDTTRHLVPLGRSSSFSAGSDT